MGPQEMLDRAEVKNKWQLTPLKDFKSPRLTERMWRTAVVVLLTSLIYEYLIPGGRNPCFALIGAVYGVGSRFEEGFHNGINRLIGTFVGGILVIPFYMLYQKQPFGIPAFLWLAAAGISPKAVRQAASIDLKAQEPGILQLVEKYGWQYRTFSAEELETAEGEFTPSPFVKKITGIDNVCERSAVLAGGRLIKKKKAADGVTVALAAADWRAVF